MPIITDGYGHVLKDSDMGELAELLYKYIPLDTAAPMIDPTWTRHHIHKELKQNRVYLSDILIIEDEQLYSPFSEHKKMFITIDEIERLKEDVAKRPKRKLERCEWCNRIIRFCESKPCPDREKTRPEFKQSVDTVERFFARHIEAKASRKRTFSKYTKDGKRKVFTR